ncbi:MAG: hypothetical protein IJ588_08795 [Prevotella sp.]|nr:hypothetical protein [Prevotella sp.]
MGAYADNLKRQKSEQILNDLLSKETDNGKIESLKEVLNLLSQAGDGSTKLDDIINTKITAALTAATGDTGLLTTWADARYQPLSE